MLLYLAWEQKVIFPQNFKINSTSIPVNVGGTGSSTTISGREGVIQPDLSSCPCSPENECCPLLRKWFSQSEIDKDLSVEVLVKTVNTQQNFHSATTKQEVKVSFHVKGAFLEQLCKQVISCTKATQSHFRITVILENIQYFSQFASQPARGAATCDNLIYGEVTLKTEDLMVPIGDGPLKAEGPGKQYVWTNGTWDAWNNRCLKMWANVTIALLLDDQDLTGIAIPLSKMQNIYERMLKEEVDTNAVLVAGNGVRVKCHKSFLMVRSPVFKAIFESNMVEATTSTLDLTDMTEAGVRALLAFLYYADITEAKKDCEVAFELFEAGHKYDVEDLEETMKRLIVDKDLDWFSVDMALSLLLFARNLVEGAELKTKAEDVLKKMDLNKVLEASVYQQVFQESPEAAKDLLECIFPHLN